MADTLDPYILFQGAGGVNPTQAANTRLAISRLAMDRNSRAVQDAQAQIALQQAQEAQQIQKDTNDYFRDQYKKRQQGIAPGMTPGDVAANGGSSVPATGTSPTGRPTIQTPQDSVPVDAGTPAPISATTSAPPTVIAGAGGPQGGALPADYAVPEGQLYSQSAQEPAPDAQPLSAGIWDDQAEPGQSDAVKRTQMPTENLPSGAPAPGTAGSQPLTPASPVSKPQNPINAIDWAPGLRDYLISKGHGMAGLAAEQAIVQHVTKIQKDVADTSEAVTKAENARKLRAADELEEFIDAKKGPQDWQGFLNRQVKSGHLTQDEADQHAAFPGADQLPVYHAALMGDVQAREWALKGQQAKEAQARADELASPETKAKRVADSYKAIAEMDEKRRENVANVLSQAARQGPQQYAAAYAKIPDDIRPNFPTPDKYDPENTPDEVMLAGLNNAQKASWFERQTTMANAESNRALLRQQAHENYELHASEFAFRKAQGTKEDKASLRQAQTEIEKLQGEERNLYPTIGALRAQIQNAEAGRSYINIGATGGATGYALSGKTPTLDAMKERYADLQEKAAEIIGNKYDVMDKVGGTPRVSREQALANLHTPTKQAAPPPAAAPTATATAPPQPAAKPVPVAAAPAKSSPAAAPPIDVPQDIKAGLKVGVARKVNTPHGAMTIILKPDGKVYQQ